MLIFGSCEKAKRYLQAHSQDSSLYRKSSKPGPCITISRETGAGADIVSNEIIDFFQSLNDDEEHPWAVFDKNLIEKVIEFHKLPQKFSQYFVEDKFPELKYTLDEVLGIHPHAWVFISKTSSTIHQLAQMGNVVIIGRAANIITAHMKNAFHVRLVAPLENRIRHIQEIHQKDRKSAIEFIKREDIARSNYLKKYFNKNVEDPQFYHLIINTGFVSYKKAARMIALAVIENMPELFPDFVFTSQYEFA